MRSTTRSRLALCADCFEPDQSLVDLGRNNLTLARLSRVHALYSEQGRAVSEFLNSAPAVFDFGEQPNPTQEAR
jgi:hypothetical protein